MVFHASLWVWEFVRIREPIAPLCIIVMNAVSPFFVNPLGGSYTYGLFNTTLPKTVNLTTTDPPSGTSDGFGIAGYAFIYMLMGLLYNIWYSIPWSITYLPMRYLGFRVYRLLNREECLRIAKRLKGTTSHTGDEDKGYGWAVGKWYIVYIDQHRDEFDIWLFATESSYKYLTLNANDEPIQIQTLTPSGETITVSGPPPKIIKIYERMGSYNNTWYKKRVIRDLNYIPRPEQAVIMREIQDIYQRKRHAVIFIHGPPCTGKSVLGLLLSEVYNGPYCNSFAPWEPGDSLHYLTDEADPTKEHPLIVSIDEIDVPLTMIHEGIVPHKNIPTLTRNKMGWNRFIDNFQRGLVPNVILLLTSNKSPEYLSEHLDASYLREERVDRVFEMKV